MENTYLPTGLAMLDKLIKNGITAGKLTMIVGQNKQPTIPFLRRCLCTQIIGQGDCRLGEIVRQVRMDSL